MANPFDAPDGSFLILVNAEGQHSLWPAPVPVPAGWTAVHGPAGRSACVEYVQSHWRDLRPLSLAATMDAPLSFNQEFLTAFDRGEDEGAFGDRHTLVLGWRVTGEIDVDILHRALDDVVARHESLRTTLAGGRQVVHPPRSPRLEVRDLAAGAESRERCAEELLNEVDAAALGIREIPHLYAVLGRFDRTDAVLVLATHHTATDHWSLQVMIRDLAAYYAGRAARVPVELPDTPPYRAYAIAQRAAPAGPLQLAREFWREWLRGAEILAIRTDRPRPAGVPNRFAVHRFEVDAELTASMRAFARSSRSSPFMVLLAAYQLLLHQRTGATDLVVPTFTAARDERFQHTVGMFFNFLPLRTDIAGCETLREVAARTRSACLEAHAHEIPFPLIAAEAPELTRQLADDDRTVVTFELLHYDATAQAIRAGDVSFMEIRRRVLSQQSSSHIPDGGLWAMDLLPGGGMVGSLKYNPNLLDESTVVELADGHRELLWTLVNKPDTPMRTITGG